MLTSATEVVRTYILKCILSESCTCFACSLEDVRLGILKYDTMCLYRDRVTGVLRGTFAFSTSIKEVDGQKCTIFKVS